MKGGVIANGEVGNLKHIRELMKGGYKMKTFGETIGRAKWYPDLPKVALKDLIDVQFELTDAIIVEDFESRFGLSTFALLLGARLDGGTSFTTLCGGMVVVKKIRKAVEEKLLPLLATIFWNDHYYDII